MYRLLIVDDEAIIRQGLGMLPWKENEIGRRFPLLFLSLQGSIPPTMQFSLQ